MSPFSFAMEALVVRFERFQVDSRFIIETVPEGDRVEKGDVVIARFVFAQKNEVAEFGLSFFDRQIVADVKFRSDDRFDPDFFAGVEKSDRAVHVAVVGDGKSGHPEVFCTLGDRRDPCRAVQDAIFRMNV